MRLIHDDRHLHNELLQHGFYKTFLVVMLFDALDISLPNMTPVQMHLFSCVRFVTIYVRDA